MTHPGHLTASGGVAMVSEVCRYRRVAEVSEVCRD